MGSCFSCQVLDCILAYENGKSLRLVPNFSLSSCVVRRHICSSLCFICLFYNLFLDLLVEYGGMR